MLLLFLLRQNPFGEGTRAKMQFYGFSKPRMKTEETSGESMRSFTDFSYPFVWGCKRCPKSAAGLKL